jgi:multidrug efflux pump subunit AcrB
MNALVRWAVANRPAMNILLVAAIGVGWFLTTSLNRELFPEFDMEQVTVSVAYPGATPDEIEEGICQKIEEAVRSVAGVKKVTSTSTEGSGTVTIELKSDVDNPDRVFNEIRAEVDRIPSFPEMAEDPEIRRRTFQDTAIRVGVLGPAQRSDEGDLRLREVAEHVRDDLLLLPGVSDVQVTGGKDYQIDVEIPEDKLRAHNLSLSEVARIVRRENHELPGGTIRARSQEVVVRGHNRRLRGEEIAKLPLVSDPGGAVLTVGELGTVRDEFDDTTAVCEINGEPGLGLSVIRNKTEDLLAVVDSVYEYVRTAAMPEGYRLVTWNDQSIDVRDRVRLLVVNGLQGLAIVIVLLTLFLDLRTAFWVAVGIPFAVFSTGAVLFFTGDTLNLLSMFAFIMALGILVDDAIVVSENIHAHRQSGKSPMQAAIDGTCQVIPSVTSSVLTTVIAFVPLMFVSGMMGKMLSVLPYALIAMLLISMLEAFTVLPCHMSHDDSGIFRFFRLVFYAFHWVGRILAAMNRYTNRALEWFIRSIYRPSIGWALHNRSIVVAIMVGALIVAVGLVRGGIVPFVIMGKLDSNNLVASVAFPDGTPGSVTDRWTSHIEEAFWRINERYGKLGTPLAKTTCRVVGTQVSSRPGTVAASGMSHKGSVEVELVDSASRPLSSQEVLALWREESGAVPGVDSLKFDTMFGGPNATPIEFKLLADKESAEQLEKAVQRCKHKLAEFPGVFDIADDDAPGKWEYRVRIKDGAVPMGVLTADLAETVRAAYYGEEVMRIQRGRHEVKIMVRYPREDRHTLANFEQIRVRTADGVERPLTELAEVEVVRGYSVINRVDQRRCVTISADVDENAANAFDVVAALRNEFLPQLFRELPEVNVRWEGQQEQTEESMTSLAAGFTVAMLAILILLAMEFKSYFQPLLIMLIIPFGMVGAIVGHLIMGHPLGLFSMLGFVGLSGIVINDSIVLIDFVNMKLREGTPVRQALIDAGCQRLRPVLLTSTTTIGGLMTLMFETSRQAQMLVPMAISLAWGVSASTLLVLYLVPVFYSVYADLHDYFTGHGGLLRARKGAVLQAADVLPDAACTIGTTPGP